MEEDDQGHRRHYLARETLLLFQSKLPWMGIAGAVAAWIGLKLDPSLLSSTLAFWVLVSKTNHFVSGLLLHFECLSLELTGEGSALFTFTPMEIWTHTDHVPLLSSDSFHMVSVSSPLILSVKQKYVLI